MSEEATLDEFVREGESYEKRQTWKSVRLQEVAYKRSDNVDPQEVDLERHIGLEHIRPNNPVPNWESLDDLSSTKRRFKPGDILFAKLRPNLEKSAQPEFEGVASTDIFPIVAGQDVNSKWLLYRLSSKPAYDYARRTSAGTRMPRTSWNLFSNFEFDLPPLPEQRKIATVLYTVDRAIEQTDKIKKQVSRIKNGVAQSLFREGINNSDTEDTWLGKVPVDWEIVPFSEIIESSRNGVYKSESSYGSGTPILKMGNMFGDIVFNGEEMERLQMSDEELEKYQLQSGDLLFARRSLNVEGAGECTQIGELNEPTVFESSLIRIRLSDEANPHFYAQYFEGPVGSKSIERIVTTTTASGIAGSDLKNLRIPKPSLQTQEKIATQLFQIDQRVALIENEKRRLNRLKRGLMQDLLSGTVRTTDTNIEVPDKIAQYG